MIYFTVLSALFTSCLSVALAIGRGCQFPVVFGACVLAAPLMFFAAFEGPLSGSGVLLLTLAVLVGAGTYINVHELRSK